MRDEHAGGSVHLVSSCQEALDDDVLDAPHEDARVYTPASQVPQERAQGPFAALVVNLRVLVTAT